MYIYRDILTGDDVLSDSFAFENTDNTERDCFIEVNGALVSSKFVVDESMFGGNAATDATEEDESAEGAITQSGINIVLNHSLKEIYFPDKNAFKATMKSLMRKVIDHYKAKGESEEGINKIKGRLSKGIQLIIKDYNNIVFYGGERYEHEEAMPIAMNYREDDITPYFWYLKDGFKLEKC